MSGVVLRKELAGEHATSVVVCSTSVVVLQAVALQRCATRHSTPATSVVVWPRLNLLGLSIGSLTETGVSKLTETSI
jgi:hypothetical protein